MSQESTDEDSFESEGVGNFRLVGVLTTPSINPGDAIEIEYYFTGAGSPFRHPPSNAKLYVNFAGIQPETDVKITSSIQGGTSDDSSNYYIRTGSEALRTQSVPVHSPSFTYGLGKHFFVGTQSDTYSDPNVMPPIHGEVKQNGHAPLHVMIKTDSSQSPGEYQIRSVLTYEQKGVVSSDESTAEIHVNNWLERHQRPLKIIGLIIAAVALALALASFGLDVWDALF